MISPLSYLEVLEVEVGEIKSSWELAMEKAEKLGKLSPEELRKQEEEKYDSIAQVLAEKLLGGLAFWQLEIDLDKYGAQQGAQVRAALRRKLIEAIKLSNPDMLPTILEGLSNLMDSATLKPVKEEIEQLFQEYEEFEQKEARQGEEAAREVLHQLRISGSAISGVNPRVLPEWGHRLETLAQPLTERLESLKSKLKAA